MNYKFTFKHLEPLESITDYAQTRFEKLEKLNLHKEMKVHFIFSVQREDQMAEVLVDNGSHHYAAAAKDPVLYAAIDKVVDKIGKQLRKHKEKIQNHHAESFTDGYLRKELADQARALRAHPDDSYDGSMGGHGTAKVKFKKTS